MKRFIVVVALYVFGAWVVASPADAKVRWVFCAYSKPKLGIPYPHIRKADGTHTRLKCSAPGWWIRVDVPW